MLAKALVLKQAPSYTLLAPLEQRGHRFSEGELYVADITNIPSSKRDAILEARSQKALEWITTNPSKITHARMLDEGPVDDGEEKSISWQVELMEDDYKVMVADSRGILTRRDATESEKQILREESDPELVAKWQRFLEGVEQDGWELPENREKTPLFEEGDKPAVKAALKELQKRGRLRVEEIEKILSDARKEKAAREEVEIS